MPETLETRLSDRELILHLTQHVEAMHETLRVIEAELEVFRPLLRRMAPAGKIDMISLMQARREMKRGG